jgi:hypothetical protein
MYEKNQQTVAHKLGPIDEDHLTADVVRLVMADAMVLLFQRQVESKAGHSRDVKMFCTVAGEFTVFRNSLEMYRGVSMTRAIQAYNSAIGEVHKKGRV